MTVDDVNDVLFIEQHQNPNPWTRQIFIDCLNVRYPSYVLCDTNQDIVGFLMTSLMVDELHLLNIAISPSYRRQGLGSRLIDFLKNKAESYNAKQIILEVRESNTAAIQLYQLHQFKQIGIRKDYYKTSTGREHAVVYSHMI